jgi:hypothetical protein
MSRVIYRATNKTNNKVYIGFDSKWPRRKIAHKTKTKTGSNLYFHNAIRKYGWDNFDWEVLKEDATPNDEIVFIHQYRSNEKNTGYRKIFYQNMWKVSVGKRTHCGGYTCRKIY